MSTDTASSQPRPLADVRVVDFTTVLAGPYATYQLALLGADVVKVERPGGEFSRDGAAVVGIPELSVGYVAQNAGKRSIVIDLGDDAGRTIAHALIDRADVVVENFAPGVANRLGIGYEAIAARRPSIVYASLSGYGQTGPYGPRPAYDHVIQAMSGVTMLTGAPDTVPNRIGPPLFDYLAGVYGAFAVVSALMERARTGRGQRVDIAMLDAALVAMASTASGVLNGGLAPKANGNVAASGSPASGIFRTKDGLLSMTGNNERQIVRLCEALGQPSLLDDARFADPQTRRSNASEFRAAIEARLAMRTAQEWEALLSARHVPAARVRTLDEALADPHVVERQAYQRMVDPRTGVAVAVPTLGVRWNGHAIGPSRPPSRLDADAASVLAELGLGSSDAEGSRT